MIMRVIRIFFLILVISTSALFGQTKESNQLILKKEKVGILQPFPSNYVKAVKGDLILEEDSITFVPYKDKYKKKSFSYGYSQMEKVKGWGAFIVPNPWFIPTMIKIKLKNGKKVILVTFSERKKILSILKNKVVE